MPPLPLKKQKYCLPLRLFWLFLRMIDGTTYLIWARLHLRVSSISILNYDTYTFKTKLLKWHKVVIMNYFFISPSLTLAYLLLVFCKNKPVMSTIFKSFKTICSSLTRTVSLLQMFYLLRYFSCSSFYLFCHL